MWITFTLKYEGRGLLWNDHNWRSFTELECCETAASAANKQSRSFTPSSEIGRPIQSQTRRNGRRNANHQNRESSPKKKNRWTYLHNHHHPATIRSIVAQHHSRISIHETIEDGARSSSSNRASFAALRKGLTNPIRPPVPLCYPVFAYPVQVFLRTITLIPP